jgi:hypothetical protein
MLAAGQGDTALAAEHFEAALHRHRQTGERLLLAGTLRDASRALRDPAMLQEAEKIYATLEIDPASRGHDAEPPSTRVHPSGNTFRRDGDGWLVGMRGAAHHMRDTKGMHDLARLLAQPDADVHVLDLVAAGQTVRSDAPGDPIDGTARDQYRARLVEIERELADADDRADVARSEQLHLERDALVSELSSAYGIGGRARRRSDSSERARSAVTQRIRDAIARIEAVDPDLGGHLRRAVRTGTFCVYSPEHPTPWEL